MEHNFVFSLQGGRCFFSDLSLFEWLESESFEATYTGSSHAKELYLHSMSQLLAVQSEV